MGNAIDQLVALFQGHAAAWAPTLLGYATALFAGLAVIEFVWVVGFSLARRVELPDLIATVVQQIVTIGFFYWLMHNSPTFLKAIIDSFRMAGSGASVATGGAANMSASNVFALGANLAYSVWQGMSWDHPLLGFLLVIAGVIVVLVFGYLVALMVEVLVESLIVSYAGVVMMGFGGNVYTRQYATAQYRYAISVGAKLMVLQLIIGLGASIISGWSSSIVSAGAVIDWKTIAVMIGAPIVLVRLAMKVPQLAQDMVMGNITGTYGSLGSTAQMVAAASAGASIALAGAGAAGVASFQLAGRQMAQRMQSAADGSGGAGGASGLPPGRITQAAMMAGMAARNLGRATANDVGKRLTGQYGAQHGYRGWRVASALNDTSKEKS